MTATATPATSAMPAMPANPAGRLDGAGTAGWPAPVPASVPFLRLVRSELRWVFRRPRTIVSMVALALLPIALGIGTAAAGSSNDPDLALLAQAAGNGLVLPIAAIGMAIVLLLPLVVSMSAADAIAGETAHGTLHGLLVAPVGRIRLVAVKAVGVLAVAAAAVTTIAVTGALTGFLVVGNGSELVTTSGTTLSTWNGLGRLALLVGWTVVQLAAVGAVALAVSTLTEHPLVVLAVTVGGLLVITLLGAVPALDWLQPVLLPTSWDAISDLLRDPMPTGALVDGTFRAGCYLLIGLSGAVARVVTRDF